MTKKQELTPDTLARKEALEAAIVYNLALDFGRDLPQLLIPTLLEEASQNTAFALHIYGGAEIDDVASFAKELVAHNSMAREATSGEKAAKENFENARQMAFEALSPENKMNYSRNEAFKKQIDDTARREAG